MNSAGLFRRADVNDLSALQRLETQCFADAWSVSMLEESLNNSRTFFFVAEGSAGLIGYCCLLQLTDHEFELLKIAVSPAARNAGLARDLWNVALAELSRDNSCDTINVLLEVRPSNAAALRLYEKLGFAEYGRRPNYYHNPAEDALLMRGAWPCPGS